GVRPRRSAVGGSDEIAERAGRDQRAVRPPVEIRVPGGSRAVIALRPVEPVVEGLPDLRAFQVGHHEAVRGVDDREVFLVDGTAGEGAVFREPGRAAIYGAVGGEALEDPAVHGIEKIDAGIDLRSPGVRYAGKCGPGRAAVRGVAAVI